jgi:hypothetical protein
MGKKYKAKTCAFCCIPGASETGDHVIAKSFFLDRKRADLPKVPACRACNKAKSDIEHYLTAVLPFGGIHPDAHETLESMVPGRLEKNPALHQQLAQGIKYGPAHAPSMTVPFDYERLRRLIEFIARGLAFYHWNLLLPEDSCTVHGFFLSTVGTAIYERIFASNARQRVKVVLGDGVFSYEGAQAVEPQEFTIWRMSPVGAVLADESAGEIAKVAYVLTALKEMSAANEFIRLLAQGRQMAALNSGSK